MSLFKNILSFFNFIIVVALFKMEGFELYILLKM